MVPVESAGVVASVAVVSGGGVPASVVAVSGVVVVSPATVPLVSPLAGSSVSAVLPESTTPEPESPAGGGSLGGVLPPDGADGAGGT